MFNNLQGLALGIIGFAIIIGVGVVVLQKFGDSVANCGANVYNTSTSTCYNSTGSDMGVPSNGAWTSTNYLNTQLGSTGGGLATWTPAVIALSVGLLFLGAFLMKNKKY